MQVDFLTVIAPIMVLTVLVIQILATLRVRRDTGSSAEQKGIQLRLIWLLPLVGATLVLAMLHDEPAPSKQATVAGQTQTIPPGTNDRRKLNKNT